MTLSVGQNADFSRAYDLLKKTYANKVEDLVPETDRLAKDLPFIASDKQPGQDYNQPVVLTREGGATWWSDGSAKLLNMPLATKELTASIRGSELAVRSILSYKFIHSALKQVDGTRAGMRAFVNATKDRFEKLTKGASYFRECALLYGGGTAATTNLGVVLNTTGSATTNLVIQMDPKDWATAIWSGSEELEFDIYSSAGVKRNTAGTTTDTVYKLVSCDPGNYRLTFTSHATNVSAVVATDQIFFMGARTQDALGLIGASLTQTGNLWGISTTTYGLWRPTIIDAGGALTFTHIAEAGANVASTGFYGDYTLYVNPATFADVCNDQTALVSHTTRTSGKVTIGFDDVAFRSQAGTMRLAVHPYMKRGLALGVPDDHVMRIGSTDLTHTIPGYGKMFRELEGAAGVEMRLYSDQAPFCRNPKYMILFNNIVNTTDAA